jgi:E3 ubiquitin-protein ligase RNF5
MDPNRRICPICRQKIDKVPTAGKFGQKGKGFYSLELKLMTKKVERSSNVAA